MAAVNGNGDAHHGDEGIDYSDIEAKYRVSYEDGFDAVIVLDNLPLVSSDKKDRLQDAVSKYFKKQGAPKPSSLFMPWDSASDSSKGYAFVEFSNADEAAIAAVNVHGTYFDKRHQLSANRFTDIERFADMDETYIEPSIDEYQQKEHLRSWLADSQGRDQFATFRDATISVMWHSVSGPQSAWERNSKSALYVDWSPLGTYLLTINGPGVQLLGGASWNTVARLVHQNVKLVSFSPNENYAVTWSPEPMAITDSGPPEARAQFTEQDEGNQIAVWDIKTGTLLRTFPPIYYPRGEDEREEDRKRIIWPALKWSQDDKYVARVTPGTQISVYQLPTMDLVEKKSIKIEGVADFEWCPIGDKDREGSDGKKGAAKKDRENMFVYWTPEVQNQPARVSLMGFPSRTVLRSKNLFNVADCKMHWQSQGDYLCVKVDRHTKTKKSIFCNLEIFRIREKDFPVEVIELKDTVVDFAWEPAGEKFAIIHTSDPNLGSGPGITVRTDVSFYAHDKSKGDFRLLKNLPNKTTNLIAWSPRGRHVVLGTVGNSNSFALEFFDTDFSLVDERNKDGPSAQTSSTSDWGSGVQLLSPSSAEHYGITSLLWDPSGRYVVTVASAWQHSVENGYAIWDWRGNELEKHIIDKFKQFLWRHRPRTLLPKDQQKQIRRNLREYSRVFDEEDEQDKSTAGRELVEMRKRLVGEWNAWRAQTIKQLEADGLPTAVKAAEAEKESKEDKEEVKEWVEELIETIEEVIV